MARSTPFWRQRYIWAVAVGVASLAAWIVGLGTGLRGWMMTDVDLGIVGHAQGFGEDAFVWWIPASILTLTAVVIGIGTAVVRHLVDSRADVRTDLQPVEPVPPVPALEDEQAPKNDPAKSDLPS